MALAVLAAQAGLAGPAAAGGSTPGSYSFYGFPQTVSNLSSVSFGTLVSSDPGRANVFWSHQFSLTNGQNGYIGMQRHRTDPGLFLFSVWGATNATPGDTGTYCTQFTEGTPGFSCRLKAGFKANDTYRYDVTRSGNDSYQARVTDATDGQAFTLGTIQVGSTVWISSSGMTDWVEYFDWNNNAANCTDEPYSQAQFTSPTATPAGTAATVDATVTGTKVSATCSAQAKVTATASGSTHADAIGNSSSGSITGLGGKCVDVTGGGSANGTPVELWTCGQWKDNQNWVRANDGSIHALFKCLTAAGAENGSAVQLSACDGSQAQQWTLTNETLVNRLSGRCLDAPNFASANGTKLDIWDCNGGANQQWNTPA